MCLMARQLWALLCFLTSLLVIQQASVADGVASNGNILVESMLFPLNH